MRAADFGVQADRTTQAVYVRRLCTCLPGSLAVADAVGPDTAANRTCTLMLIKARVQVLIPAEQNYHVEAWVYERSPQELKQAVQAAQRKRELGEVGLRLLQMQ